MIFLLQSAYVLLLFWYRHHWQLAENEISFQLDEDELPFVSIVVAVRNEEKNLPDFLKQISEQEYPVDKLEWIFVDDHSDDHSILLLQQSSAANIRFLSLDSVTDKGKKAALKKGIVNANGSWILTTDVDCRLHTQWIRVLVAMGVQKRADMVCGTVEVTADVTFLQNFQAMETAILQSSGAGSLHAGFPLLNTGASLAFKKSAWELVQGYQSNENIASGDDTFLMLSMHQHPALKVAPCVLPAARVATMPANTWRDVLVQRLRWNGKIKHYPVGYIHLVGIIVFFSAVTGLFVVLKWMFWNVATEAVCMMFFMRLLAEFSLLRTWQISTGKKFSWIQMTLMSLFYPLFTVFSMVCRPFMRMEWKGRACE